MPRLPGPLELIIVLLIVVLIFGPGRLGKLAGELGKGIRSFRQGLKGPEDPSAEKRTEETETSPEGK